MYIFIPQHDNIIGLKPKKYRCKIPGCDDENFKFDDFSPDLFPLDDSGSPDYCSYYQPSSFNVSSGKCSTNSFDKNNLVSCPQGSQFAFGDFEFEETLVTELNAVCGKVETFENMLATIRIFIIYSNLHLGQFSSATS